MSYTTELIDAFKKKHNLESDYAAARLLEIRPNRISNYRTGVSHADDKTAIMLADALGLDRLETIARINMDRATDRTDKAFWRKLAATTTLVAFAVVPLLNPVAAYTPHGQQIHAERGTGVCIMRSRARIGRWIRRITLALLRGRDSPALLA